ncbi:hypothetical protein ABL78_1881 [Leptomonas seymouri]|uniref:Uncharacterized protein n=1 Tax=Leptomonas seymouri TaxID=5684 RepID=A0A0N0P816_LEPSE|nr:hypothetical protein ABL78_1881 [Leptomonas seymouri]|eukprot:KPI88997.1 hypothetical protein ABL78_1881 [Leptomonas seymouri]
MSSSSSVSAAPIDPYVLEFAVNFKWLLHYATQHLDPTMEAHYPSFIADVANMQNVLSHITFERGCTLSDMPLGALRMSRESVLYLLVCDHLLGGCPPTMHSFLQQAFGSSHRSAISDTAGGEKSGAAVPSVRVQTQTPDFRSKKSTQHADLNVSVPSSGVGSADGAEDRDGEELATERVSQALDGKPLGTLDSASAHVSNSQVASTEGKVAQAALLLLRWMFVEGILSEEELAVTLNLDTVDGGAPDVNFRITHQRREATAFQRHQRLAYRLAELIPFYLGAHLLISRCILLQYSATLLTVDGVMQHVKRLEAPLEANSDCVSYSATRPPRSVEGALLEWFQAVIDSTRRQARDQAAASEALTGCSPLRNFIEHGPFCRNVLDPSERDFFRLVQCGECVCIALWFYCPDALPLTELSRALREAERFVLSHPPGAELFSHEESISLFQRHQSLCYWTAIHAASRYLGVTPLLSQEEVVVFGRTALPLHLFVFIQQLFAVLATNAEEEVRVSADTAWWEQTGNADGYTEPVEVGVKTKPEVPNRDTDTYTSAIVSTRPGALHALRQSMRDSFPPEAFHQFRESGEGRYHEEDEIVAASPNVPARAAPSRTSTAPQNTVKENDHVDLDEASPTEGKGAEGLLVTAISVSAAAKTVHTTGKPNPLTKESRDTDQLALMQTVEAPLVARRTKSNKGSRSSSSSATSTHFTVEFAGTLRAASVSSPKRDGALETATSVLRPMVQRRTDDSGDAAADAHSYSRTTFTSIGTQRMVLTEKYEEAIDSPSGSEMKVQLAEPVVNTYIHTPDEAPLSADELARLPEIKLDSLEDGTLWNEQFKPDERPIATDAAASALRGALHSAEASEPGKGPATSNSAPTAPVALDMSKHLRSLGEPLSVPQDNEPSSPWLPDPRNDTTRRPSAFSDFAPHATLLHAIPQLSASSATYSSDFVVQSGIGAASESPMNKIEVAVDRSASFSSTSVLEEAPKDDLAAPSSLQVPLCEEVRAGDSRPVFSSRSCSCEEARREADAHVSNSAVFTKTTTIVKDVVGCDSRSGTPDGGAVSPARSREEGKERSVSTASRVLSRPSLSSASLSAVAVPEHPAQSAAAPSKKYGSADGSLPVPSASSTIPRAASTAPANRSFSNTDTSPERSAAGDNVALSSAHLSFDAEIAVEEDHSFCISSNGEASGMRNSFPTPRHEEEANRLRGLRAVGAKTTCDNALPQMQRTPTRGSIAHTSAHDSVPLDSVLSPSPIQPDKELWSLQSGVRPADRLLRSSSPSHHSMDEKDSSSLEDFSPRTSALMQSVSEVYGTDGASLLEDAGSSHVSLSQRRRLLHSNDESWFSSVSHSHRQSMQSTAGTMMSLGSVCDSTHVRDLVCRLRSVAVESLRDKDADELREALAKQQELVQQLASVLQERAGSRVGVRRFAPATRPRERKRTVHVRCPSEDLQRDTPTEGQRSVSPSLQTELKERHGDFTAERLRQRSLSGMTVESRASPTRSAQTDLSAQLAEPDVSSLLADILLPAKSVSPTRAKAQ